MICAHYIILKIDYKLIIIKNINLEKYCIYRSRDEVMINVRND